MKGRDMRCPECGKGFPDVIPDYDLDEDTAHLAWSGLASSHMIEECEGGHIVWINSTLRDGKVQHEFKVSAKNRHERRRPNQGGDSPGPL